MFIMGYHGVHLFRLTVELDVLATIFVASGAGFLVGTLRVIILRVFLEYFAICHRLSGAMYQAYFCIGQPIQVMG